MDPCLIYGCWRIDPWLCCLAEILSLGGFLVLLGGDADWVVTQQVTQGRELRKKKVRVCL